MINFTEHLKLIYGSHAENSGDIATDSVRCSYYSGDVLEVIECPDSSMTCCGPPSYRYCCEQGNTTSWDLMVGVAFAGSSYSSYYRCASFTLSFPSPPGQQGLNFGVGQENSKDVHHRMLTPTLQKKVEDLYIFSLVA